MQRPQEKAPDALQEFRSSLKDVIAVLEAAGPLFKTWEELAQSLELGLTNDGQAQLWLERMTEPAKK